MKKNFLKPGTNPWYGIVTFWQPVSKDYCRQIITLLLLHRVPINNCCSYTCFPNFCFIHCFSVAHLFFYNWLINHFEKVRYCIIWIHWNENYNLINFFFNCGCLLFALCHMLNTSYYFEFILLISLSLCL